MINLTEIKRGYTSAIPLTFDGRVLLQRKTEDYSFWPNCWATFGGGIKIGENPLESVLREFRAETGIDLENPRKFYEQEFTDESKIGERKRRWGIIYWFASELNGNLGKIKITEGAEYGVFTEDKLDEFFEQNLIIPYQYKTLKRFFESFRAR